MKNKRFVSFLCKPPDCTEATIEVNNEREYHYCAALRNIICITRSYPFTLNKTIKNYASLSDLTPFPTISQKLIAKNIKKNY